MDYLIMNKEDVNLPFAKALGLRYGLSVEHDEDCPRGWMIFFVNGQIWARQYVNDAPPVVISPMHPSRRLPWMY